MVDFNTIKENFSGGIEALGSKFKGAKQKIAKAFGHLWSMRPGGRAQDTADRASNIMQEQRRSSDASSSSGEKTITYGKGDTPLMSKETLSKGEEVGLPKTLTAHIFDQGGDWTFKSVYENKELYNALHKFLEKEYAQENLDFPEAVLLISNPEKEKTVGDYQEIFNKFLSSESLSQVNLPRHKNSVKSDLDNITTILKKSSLSNEDVRSLNDSFDRLAKEIHKDDMWLAILQKFAGANEARLPNNLKR